MNKKFFVFITIIQITISGVCQIGTTNVASPVQKQPETTDIFDSTKNFLGDKNVNSYAGQLLYVLPKADNWIKNGYSDFKPININPNRRQSYELVHYGEDSEENEFNTKYDNLVGKYFYVDSVRLCENYMASRRTHYFFYLTERDNPSIRCCFVYDPVMEYKFPFIVVSHFEYLKKNYIGKKFIIASNYLRKHDLITGDSIIIADEAKTTWTITDISIINDKDRKLSVIVKSGNITSYVKLSSFYYDLTSGVRRRVFEKSEWDKLVAKYGFSMMQSVLSEKISIDMPVELLIMSWGKPDKINSSSYGDQYVYNKQYVYVKGGKVTAWN